MGSGRIANRGIGHTTTCLSSGHKSRFPWSYLLASLLSRSRTCPETPSDFHKIFQGSLGQAKEPFFQLTCDSRSENCHTASSELILGPNSRLELKPCSGYSLSKSDFSCSRHGSLSEFVAARQIFPRLHLLPLETFLSAIVGCQALRLSPTSEGNGVSTTKLWVTASGEQSFKHYSRQTTQAKHLLTCQALYDLHEHFEETSLLSEASDISGTHQSIAAWSTFVYHLCPTTSGLVDSVTSSSSTRGLVPADSAVSLSTSALAVIQGSGAHRRTQEVLLLARLVWSSREGLPRILRLHPRLPAHEGIHDGREREEKPAIIDDVFFRGIASLASLPLRLVVPSPYFTAGSSTRQINLQEAEEADAFNCLLPPFNSLVFLHNARLVVESIPTFPSDPQHLCLNHAYIVAEHVSPVELNSSSAGFVGLSSLLVDLLINSAPSVPNSTSTLDCATIKVNAESGPQKSSIDTSELQTATVLIRQVGHLLRTNKTVAQSLLTEFSYRIFFDRLEFSSPSAPCKISREMLTLTGNLALQWLPCIRRGYIYVISWTSAGSSSQLCPSSQRSCSSFPSSPETSLLVRVSLADSSVSNIQGICRHLVTVREALAFTKRQQPQKQTISLTGSSRTTLNLVGRPFFKSLHLASHSGKDYNQGSSCITLWLADEEPTSTSDRYILPNFACVDYRLPKHRSNLILFDSFAQQSCAPGHPNVCTMRGLRVVYNVEFLGLPIRANQTSGTATAHSQPAEFRLTSCQYLGGQVLEEVFRTDVFPSTSENTCSICRRLFGIQIPYLSLPFGQHNEDKPVDNSKEASNGCDCTVNSQKWCEKRPSPPVRLFYHLAMPSTVGEEEEENKASINPSNDRFICLAQITCCLQISFALNQPAGELSVCTKVLICDGSATALLELTDEPSVFTSPAGSSMHPPSLFPPICAQSFPFTCELTTELIGDAMKNTKMASSKIHQDNLMSHGIQHSNTIADTSRHLSRTRRLLRLEEATCGAAWARLELLIRSRLATLPVGKQRCFWLPDQTKRDPNSKWTNYCQKGQPIWPDLHHALSVYLSSPRFLDEHLFYVAPSTRTNEYPKSSVSSTYRHSIEPNTYRFRRIRLPWHQGSADVVVPQLFRLELIDLL